MFSHIFLSSKEKISIARFRDYKEKFSKENIQTGFVVAGGRFLSYCKHQVIKFEEEKLIITLFDIGLALHN